MYKIINNIKVLPIDRLYLGYIIGYNIVLILQIYHAQVLVYNIKGDSKYTFGRLASIES